MANENDLNFYILEAISASSSPIGAGTIRVYLKKQGILRSEAGVGRNLRELQIRCLVRKDGYQGHVLTKEGLKYLESLRKYRNQSKAARDLVTQINSVDEAMMDEIFHARRAIETEAARLAAERATEKQIAMLRENIKKRKKTIDQGQNDPDLDREFHNLIFEACGNSLLRSMNNVIAMNTDLTKFFEEVRNRQGNQLSVDHFEIFEAIQSRNQKAAAEAMAKSIDNAIKSSKEFKKKKQDKRVNVKL